MERPVVKAWLFAAVGFVFFAIGAGLIISNALFDSGSATAIAIVTGGGRMAGTATNYVEYVFTAPDGIKHEGQSSGYSAAVGETIKVEYVVTMPGWNRVAGAGRAPQKWQYPIAAFGGLFTFAGLHWAFQLRRRRQLRVRLDKSGERTEATVTFVNRSAHYFRYVFEVRGVPVKGRTVSGPPERISALSDGDKGSVLFDAQRPTDNLWIEEG